MAPSDPGFVTLVLEVEQPASIVLHDAKGQTEIGQEAQLDGITTAIKDVPDTLTAMQILAQWRELERQLAGESPASDRARELRAQIDAYLRAYQRVFKDNLPRTCDRPGPASHDFEVEGRPSAQSPVKVS